ncbi:MAG: hypothetical protein U5K79_20300 [Cyclobacteriaceae bacterium]|nr:hypothetical protein [Cyclobacteriaceae bacterium]
MTKQIKRFVLVITSTFFIFFLSMLIGCGGSVEPSLNLQQKDAKALQEGSPWGGVGNVEVLTSPSGVDFSELLKLQVSFTTSGKDDWAPTFFDASGSDDFLSSENGTWYWTGSGTDVITLTNASVLELTSVDVADDEITFSFEVSPSGSGGRTTGIDGSYTVSLK